MAETNPLPDGETAYNNLLMGVAQKVFFHKLASAGMAPKSAEQAAYMLDAAMKLRAAEENEQIKAAQAGNDPYYRMSQDLTTALNRRGVPARSEADLSVKQAAINLMQDPVIYNSVIALKAQQAQDFVAQAA